MTNNKYKVIYRYQRFTTRTVESLVHDHLHFSDPTSFNDPFDCQPVVESDSDRETLRLILAILIGRRIEAESAASLKAAQVKGEKIVSYAKNLGEQVAKSKLQELSYHATNPEYECGIYEAECWLLTSEIQSELLKRYDRGVCCFSTIYNNPLLWSHYGDQHKGLCIGYNLDRDPMPILRKVEYGGSRKVKTSLIGKALLNDDQNAQESLDRDVLLRKASMWRYEREWRLFGHKGVQDSVLALKDITFGLRCPRAIMHSVISALESRNGAIEFYEIFEVYGSFKLKRRPVDTSEMRAFLPHTAVSGIEMFGTCEENLFNDVNDSIKT